MRTQDVRSAPTPRQAFATDLDKYVTIALGGNPGRVIQQDYDNGSIMNYAVPKQVVA